DLVDFAVMKQNLTEILARIIRLRADDRSVFEVDLFGDLALIEFECARLPRCCKELQQVSQTHRFQSALDCHERIRSGKFNLQPGLRKSPELLVQLLSRLSADA